MQFKSWQGTLQEPQFGKHDVALPTQGTVQMKEAPGQGQHDSTESQGKIPPVHSPGGVQGGSQYSTSMAPPRAVIVPQGSPPAPQPPSHAGRHEDTGEHGTQSTGSFSAHGATHKSVGGSKGGSWQSGSTHPMDHKTVWFSSMHAG
jgi:hypothetical protein